MSERESQPPVERITEVVDPEPKGIESLKRMVDRGYAEFCRRRGIPNEFGRRVLAQAIKGDFAVHKASKQEGES